VIFVLLVLPLIGAGIAWVRWTLAVVTVKGTSMEPTYHRGDRVLVRRTGLRRARVGQVIVIAAGRPLGAPPLDSPLLVIKRLIALPGGAVPAFRVRDAREDVVPDGRVVVAADNPDGVDSRQLGYFATGNLLGVVVRRLHRPAAGS
jgi:signal peptidase I